MTHAYLYGADGIVYRKKHTGLVAYWPFDEGSGTVANDENGTHHGTLGDGTPDHRPAWSVQRGLIFDGVDDKVKVSDSDALDLVGNALTISGLIGRDTNEKRVILQKADASNGYQLAHSATGQILFEIRIGGITKTVTSTTTLPLYDWRHVAARYDGTELRVFINGTLDTASTAATGSLAATTEPLWIGAGGTGNQDHFAGVIDDLSLYNRALSATEIANLTTPRADPYEYRHTNALGSPIVLTDDAQTVLARYEYDVFGAVRSETGTSTNTRKFTGKEYDKDVKLYKMGIRPYDPYIARFYQRDPAQDGLNWYAYAYNNPMKFIDPTGLRAVNQDERADLIYTFGHTVGTSLADMIDIEVVTTLPGKVHGRVVSKTKILLNAKHYKPNDKNNYTALYARSVLIHEVTHIWQRLTGLHRGGRGGEDYDYTFKQLATLNLKKEEHAKAVQNWFFVTYGLSTGMIGASDAWTDLANHNLNVNDGHRTPPPAAWIWNMVASAYAPVIDEIQNPNNLPNRRGWRRAVINYFTWFR